MVHQQKPDHTIYGMLTMLERENVSFENTNIIFQKTNAG